MNKALWDSFSALANLWRTSPRIQRYRSPLVGPPATPLGQAINQAVVMWAPNEEGQPLLLGSRLRDTHAREQLQNVDGFAQWEQDGLLIAQVFLLVMEWLRSRLPGYPFLAALQLVRDSPWTVPEFNAGVPWRLDLRRRRLQFVSNLGGIAEALGIDPAVHGSLMNAVAMASAQTSASQELGISWRSLSRDDLEQLARSRRELKQALAPEVAEEKAGPFVFPRGQYSAAALDGALRSLTGQASTFATALTRADRLLQDGAALFSQLIVYGEPRVLGPVVRIERLGRLDRSVEVIIDDDPFPPIRLREVVRFATPALRHALIVEGVMVKAGERMTVDGPLLRWERSISRDSGTVGPRP